MNTLDLDEEIFSGKDFEHICAGSINLITALAVLAEVKYGTEDTFEFPSLIAIACGISALKRA